MDDKKFSGSSILLLYVDDLLLCSSSQASSLEDNVHLLKLLALKGHKVTKKKLQFAKTQVQYLRYLISEQRLHLDPDRLHCVISFPKPKTKQPTVRFSQASWLLLKLDSKFLSYGQTSVCFTEEQPP